MESKAESTGPSECVAGSGPYYLRTRAYSGSSIYKRWAVGYSGLPLCKDVVDELNELHSDLQDQIATTKYYVDRVNNLQGRAKVEPRWVCPLCTKPLPYAECPCGNGPSECDALRIRIDIRDTEILKLREQLDNKLDAQHEEAELGDAQREARSKRVRDSLGERCIGVVTTGDWMHNAIMAAFDE